MVFWLWGDSFRLAYRSRAERRVGKEEGGAIGLGQLALRLAYRLRAKRKAFRLSGR